MILERGRGWEGDRQGERERERERERDVKDKMDQVPPVGIEPATF